MRNTKDAPPMTKEVLYDMLRQYGTINSLAFTSGEVAEAVVVYGKNHGAISAFKCAHRATVKQHTIHIEYQQLLKPHAIREFISNNSRIILPFAISAFVGLCAALNEPMRVFFVTNQISNRFALPTWSGPESSESTESATGLYGRLTAWLFGFRRYLFAPEAEMKNLPVWSTESFEDLSRAVDDEGNRNVILLAGPKVALENCHQFLNVFRAVARLPCWLKFAETIPLA